MFQIIGMDMLHFEGLLIGVCTFLIIGLFHPVVIKCEYYWGTRLWWVFLVLGLGGAAGGEHLLVFASGSVWILFAMDHQGTV